MQPTKMYFCWVKAVEDRQDELPQSPLPASLGRVKELFSRMQVCGVKPPPDPQGGGSGGSAAAKGQPEVAIAETSPSPDNPLPPLGVIADFEAGRARITVGKALEPAQQVVAFQPQARWRELDGDAVRYGDATSTFARLPMQVGGIGSLSAWALLDAGAEGSLSHRLLCCPVVGTLEDALAWRASEPGQSWFQGAVASGLMTFASIGD